MLFLSVRQENVKSKLISNEKCNWKLQILKYIIFNHHYNNTETSSFIYVHKLFCGIRRFINVSRFHKIFPVYYYWLFFFFAWRPPGGIFFRESSKQSTDIGAARCCGAAHSSTPPLPRCNTTTTSNRRLNTILFSWLTSC